MNLRKLFYCGLVTKADLVETEHRLSELILKVAGEGDKAKIQKLIDELAARRASLQEAIDKNT